jgi:uncharacterized protein (TIGR03086 family)
MTAGTAVAALTGGVALLERSTAYALGRLAAVTPGALGNPTPCRDWDLRTLLSHLDDSLRALYDAVAAGSVGLDPAESAAPAAPAAPGAEPVASVRRHAHRTMGAWAQAGDAGADHPIHIGDRLLTPAVVAAAGAVELAVHGWDIGRACGRPAPIPSELADELLDLCRLLVTDADRPARFAAPVEVGPGAGASDRLVAFLGRRP